MTTTTERIAFGALPVGSRFTLTLEGREAGAYHTKTDDRHAKAPGGYEWGLLALTPVLPARGERAD